MLISKEEAAAVQEAMSRKLRVVTDPRSGHAMIDGMRWDYWTRLKDREVTVFRGRVCMRVV